MSNDCRHHEQIGGKEQPVKRKTTDNWKSWKRRHWNAWLLDGSSHTHKESHNDGSKSVGQNAASTGQQQIGKMPKGNNYRILCQESPSV